MECNKDDAVRARGIAEQKMQCDDYEGARKLALKAQRLFPKLENISQLLAVCNVHCCAKSKLYASEMDWYGILQIEQSADEASINRKYRKLALLLHPDKNKLCGAEAAFKLIGEAHRILIDQTERSRYDNKCRVSKSKNTKRKPTSYPSTTECNEEEAVRARKIAEQKMQDGDYEGAKKLLLKAQKMFPKLDNILHLLTICNVHCTAKSKLYGLEMDWYGILQIAESADVASINKQYKKLALLLDPDKNNFVGAETAFKLLGEAYSILTDQTKRSQHDEKRRVIKESARAQTSQFHPSVNNICGEFTYNYREGSFTFKAWSPGSNHQTPVTRFSIQCCVCGSLNQYNRDHLNCYLNCSRCGKPFYSPHVGLYPSAFSAHQ